MHYKEARLYFKQALQANYTQRELEEITERCLGYWSGKSKLDLLFDPYDFDQSLIDQTIQKLKSNTPIQYILGFEYFGHLKLQVNESVLIPRPETEELCKWILSDFSDSRNYKVLDVGTGSGCIPIYLQTKNKTLDIYALDISVQALQIAKANAEQYACTIQFMLLDILQSDLASLPEMDILVSNPPYILPSEQQEMTQRVLQFEPHEALFVTDEDPLQFYKRIAFIAQHKLATSGCIYLELHQHHALTTEQYYREQGFQTTLRKDVYGNLRMLKAWK